MTLSGFLLSRLFAAVKKKKRKQSREMNMGMRRTHTKTVQVSTITCKLSEPARIGKVEKMQIK